MRDGRIRVEPEELHETNIPWIVNSLYHGVEWLVAGFYVIDDTLGDSLHRVGYYLLGKRLLLQTVTVLENLERVLVLLKEIIVPLRHLAEALELLLHVALRSDDLGLARLKPALPDTNLAGIVLKLGEHMVVHAGGTESLQRPARRMENLGRLRGVSLLAPANGKVISIKLLHL